MWGAPLKPIAKFARRILCESARHCRPNVDVTYPRRSDWTRLLWPLQQQTSPFSAARGDNAAGSQLTEVLLLLKAVVAQLWVG